MLLLVLLLDVLLIVIIILLLTAIIAIIIVSPSVLEKQKRNSLHGNVLGGRAQIWNTAILHGVSTLSSESVPEISAA